MTNDRLKELAVNATRYLGEDVTALENNNDQELLSKLLDFVKKCYDTKSGYCDLMELALEDIGMSGEEMTEVKKMLPHLFFVSEGNEPIKIELTNKKMDDRVICNIFGADSRDTSNHCMPYKVFTEISEKTDLFSWLFKNIGKVSLDGPESLVTEYSQYVEDMKKNSVARKELDIKRLRKMAKNAVENSDYKPITKEAKKIPKLTEDKLWDIISLFIIDSIERCDMPAEEIFDCLGAKDDEIGLIEDYLPEYF